MRSIRVFLVVVILATLVLVMFVAAIDGFRSSMAEAESLLDSQLQELAQFSVSLRAGDGPRDEHPVHIAYQLWQQDADGKLILRSRSANAPDSALVALEPGFGHGNFAGYRWRTYVHFAEQDDVVAVVAERADVRYELAENVIVEAILPIVMGLIVAGLLIWLIVGRGLSPLRELAERLRQKQYRDLSPVVLKDPPAELESVLLSVNELLARLGGAFDREKRFASDAAHELRTPISVLKLDLYNLERQYPDHARELQALQASVRRMEHLVTQLLTLYRTEPEHYSAGFKTVNLHDRVAEIIAERCSDFTAKSQNIELVGSADAGQVSFSGDSFSLDILVTNLLTNANRYTPEGGTVVVAVEGSDAGVVLRIEDSGPGIAESERDLVFERFHRGGGDRHDSGNEGSGLGLSIVRNIVRLHRATIDVCRSPLGGACFTVVFPRRTAVMGEGG